MIPKVRFPEYFREWGICELIDILEFKNGYNADKADYGIGTPFVNVSDIISNEYIIDNSLKQLVRIEEEALDRFSIQNGDLVFQRSSETREDVGTVNVYLGEQTVTFGGFVIRGRLKSKKVSPYFLKLALSTFSARKSITSFGGGSTRFNIGQESLSKVKVRLPEIEEMNRIESLFFVLSKKINLLTKKKEALETYKKGLMQKIFSQELRFKREDGTDYPEWRLTKFVEVCLKENSGLSKGDLSDVGLNEVYGAAGNLEGFTNVTSPSSDYVSIIKDGAGVGRVKFLPPNTSTIGTLDMIVAYDEFVLPYFLYILLNNIRWRKYTVGSTIPHIYFRDWKTEKVQIPSLEEQRKIVKVFSDLESKCSKILQKIERTELLKKGLLQQMFV